MMNPEMTRKIQSVLARVKDPESNLSVERLGLVKRVRYNEGKKELYIFADFRSHHPGCLTCFGIAMAVTAAIQRSLHEEFQKEFPELSIEFV